MKLHDRHSPRLKGFDYSKPGEYFVTMCTRNRLCTLGQIVGGTMRVSELGRIAGDCWKSIPDHFGNARVDVYRIMPNHVHGITTILRAPVGAEYIQARRERRPHPRRHEFQHIIPNSLGSIVRSFKAAVTRAFRRGTEWEGETVWQRNYHDHIIRNPTEYFFIKRYIRRNPILWFLDSDNPAVHAMSIEEPGCMLKDSHRLTQSEIGYLLRHERAYREWRAREERR
jgi:putative transposase